MNSLAAKRANYSNSGASILDLTLMKNKAFSLIELLTIAAIVVIIAAFAIPSYMRYITETKINAFFKEAEAAKLAVQSTYLKTHADVSNITVNSGTAEYTTTNTDYIKCITIQDGVISVVGDSDKFFGKTVWIAWIPNTSSGELQWSCTYSDDAAEYLTDVAATCGPDTCSEYGTWSTASAVGSAEDVWYFGSVSASQVAAAFAETCRLAPNTYSACADCYNYSNSDTETRYMDFSLSTVTYNYAGALGANPNWSSQTSWTYDYDYTIATQTCMSQTRTKNDCQTNPPTSYSSDGACT